MAHIYNLVQNMEESSRTLGQLTYTQVIMTLRKKKRISHL